jgi:hypothetical protein
MPWHRGYHASVHALGSAAAGLPADNPPWQDTFMRSAYRGFYPPTEHELDELWRDGFFTFDANVLLNLYRLRSSKDYLEIFAELKDRIWLPHQAGLEYHNNRIVVIHEMRAIHRSMEEDMGDALQKWKQRFTRHPSIDLDEIWRIVGTAVTEVQKIIQKAEREHPSLEQADPIRDKLAKLFAGKVGPPLSAEELQKLYKVAEQRYSDGTPPGYMDKKAPPKNYGDFILWWQVCSEAKKRNQPVTLITDERKDDWWSTHKGKTIGPRPELVAEMWEQAGVLFHMYSSEQFLRFAGKQLKKSVQLQQVEQEARTLREEEERKRQARRAAALDRLRELEIGVRRADDRSAYLRMEFEILTKERQKVLDKREGLLQQSNAVDAREILKNDADMAKIDAQLTMLRRDMEHAQMEMGRAMGALQVERERWPRHKTQ